MKLRITYSFSITVSEVIEIPDSTKFTGGRIPKEVSKLVDQVVDQSLQHKFISKSKTLKPQVKVKIV